MRRMLIILSVFEITRKVFADKGYDSRHNREQLKNKGLRDGIMKKSHRNQPLTREDIEIIKNQLCG